ncbi:efflux RND transporter periplasmic adaptor subunit [Azohydromonas sediminis]|uniref:efflux RND transporter periplasmic adaptor subunit n=1 Tax=Azohydromonas sediminis TaxID=2259674 RepID=UPI000E659906|nr:efflux RND transporter periplasmic adaptor subunit [Azohydromonas sediminis]
MNDRRPNRKWRRWVGAAAAVAAVVALAAWAFQPRAIVVDVATVTTGRFEQAIEEDGRLRLKNRYVIAAPTSGQLARPVLRVGDAVAAGDVVAVLTPSAPSMIDARTRAVLQQRVGSAEAARAAAAAQVARLETALAQARIDAERAQQLARDHFIAPSARDQAVLAQQAAQRALDAGRAEQRAADYALAEARAALARAEPAPGARVEGRWELKSPVDGRVVKLHLDSAAPVAVGQPLLEIGDTGALEAVVDVLSSDALRIAPGAAVMLSLGPGAPTLPGTVARIEPVAFTKVSALGIEEQRVNVIVDFDAAAAQGRALGDGFRIDARIVTAAHDGALLAPSAALVRDGARWRVFVVDGGRARARLVEVRDRHADAAWIESGLRDGEQVVLYPGSTMRDGQRVRVRR